jgi:hypothetical protein
MMLVVCFTMLIMILRQEGLLIQSRNQYVTSVKLPGNSYHPSTGGLLHVSELSNTVCRGYYIHTNDQTLYFQSMAEGEVRVWKPDGSTFIQYGALSHPGLHYATFYDTTFLYDAKRDTFGVTSERHQWQNIRGVTTQAHHVPVHIERVKAEVDKFLSDPDTQLLSYLSHAVGEIGIVGYGTKSAVPLHIVALSLHQETMATTMTSNLTNHQSIHSQLSFAKAHRHKRSCQEYPDPKHDCLGMCGPGCTCWKWVCGDCCFHDGCYEHDVCCGKSTVRCLMIFKFNCSSFMSC